MSQNVITMIMVIPLASNSWFRALSVVELDVILVNVLLVSLAELWTFSGVAKLSINWDKFVNIFEKKVVINFKKTLLDNWRQLLFVIVYF